MKTRAEDFQQKAEFQQKSVYRVQRKTAPQGVKEGSTKPWWNSETLARPRAREKQRDCLSMRGWPPRSSARENEGDATQEVLPQTTTTLVALKASGTTLWYSPKDQEERGLRQQTTLL